MKIKPEHYQTMKDVIDWHRDNDNTVMQIDLNSHGFSDKRVRWDILRFCKFKSNDGYLVNGITWVCDNLYPYLDDSHVDTALRNITGLKG